MLFAFLTVAAAFWVSICVTRNAYASIAITIAVAMAWMPVLNLMKYGAAFPF
jgi:hypothetical protein